MVWVRNLVLAVAAASALTSNSVFALGVGEVRLQSALNQPLLAEIEVSDAKGLARAEIKPRLASTEEFKKLGIDRSYFLTNLRFATVQAPDGRQVIRITSTKAVREPYLSFLVEVTWPTGRLVREYTLLFDPPKYAPETVSQGAPQLPGSQATPLPSASGSGKGDTASTSGAASAGRAAPTAAVADFNKTYRVANRDNLWGISERVREVGSVHQNMAAIWDLNQEAFVGGNINRVQVGQVLRLPNADEVTKRSTSEAVAQISHQTARWQHDNSAPKGEGGQPRSLASVKSPASSSRAPEELDNLRLVAEEHTPPSADNSQTKAKAGKAKGGSNEVQVLRNELAVTRESLDSSRRESAELKDRLNDLQMQLDKLSRLVQLKDNQLSDLQGRLTTPATAATAAIPAVLGSSVADAEDGDVKAQAAPDSPPITSAPSESASAPVTQQTNIEDDLLSFVMENAPLLGAVGGGVLLVSLLVLWLVSRRKNKQLTGVGATKSARSSAGKRSSLLEDSDLSDGEATPVVGETSSNTGGDEALGKADIYLAYGHFDEAARVLKSVLSENPRAVEARLKLLDVYAHMGDAKAFAIQEAEAREFGVPERRIQQLKAKLAASSVPEDLANKTKANTAAGLDFDALLDDSAHQLEASSPVSPPVSATGARQSDELAAALQTAAQQRAAKSGQAEDPFADFDWDLSEASSGASATKAKPSSKGSAKNAPPVDFDLSVPSEEPKAPKPASSKASPSDEALTDLSGDEVATKLDLAKAYIEMGDSEGAKDILNEVVAEGNDRQKRAARKLLSGLV